MISRTRLNIASEEVLGSPGRKRTRRGGMVSPERGSVSQYEPTPLIAVSPRPVCVPMGDEPNVLCVTTRIGRPGERAMCLLNIGPQMGCGFCVGHIGRRGGSAWAGPQGDNIGVAPFSAPFLDTGDAEATTLVEVHDTARASIVCADILAARIAGGDDALGVVIGSRETPGVRHAAATKVGRRRERLVHGDSPDLT